MNKFLSSLLVLLFTASGIHAAPSAGQLPPNKLLPESAAVLDGAKTATLLSLDPSQQRGERLEDYKALGSVELDEKQTALAVRAYHDAIAGWDGAVGMCFNPRHSLRVNAGGLTYDFVLCYECRQIYVFRSGKLLQVVCVKGSPKVLDSMLTAAHVPLPKPAE